MANVNMQYAYTRKRLQFGRQCNFTDYEKIEADIKPHTGHMSNYNRVDPATQGTQCSKIYSVHEVQILLDFTCMYTPLLLLIFLGKYNYCNI